MGVRLSIVVPVYKVERYLPRCLDSVLSQTGADLEVIAVDDGSPDRSGEILESHAARDPRLRVLHLERNRGLGGARAAGLAEATGEYVWFVDSDDWLAEDAVAAVAERLAAVRPDVLITGFLRSYPGGETEPDTWRRLMVDPPLPEVFTLRDRPGLLQTIMTVWNKVIRREFLLGLGVSFGEGLYEDISVTYPVLLAAPRLTYLDRPCYFYRREREGAITGTASPHHRDAFAQYDEIFAFLDRHTGPGVHSAAGPDDAADLRRLVFDRTVKHAATVYGTPGLVPPHLRRDFFHRMSAHFRGHRPAGYAYPRGPRGVQYRLVERDAFAAYEGLLTANDLRVRGRRVVGSVRSAASRAARTVRGAGRFALYHACMRLPLDEHLAVYAAYWYRGYAGNPAAIHAKARELAPSVRGVWVVANAGLAKRLPRDVRYVVENSPAYFKAMATAKYLVNNVNFPHTMTKRPGSVHVQTQHGTPLKTLGLDLRAHPEAAAGMDFDRLLEHVGRWDFLVSPNPHATAVFGRVYPGRYEVLETGYPRNDRLSTATPAEVAALRASLGIPAGNTAILYAPTHRERQSSFTPALDVAALAEALGPGHTVLLRTHYFHADGRGDLTAGAEGPGRAQLLDVSDHPSVEDLFLAADTLVTDYSSAMFDYAVLERPIVIFAPDWEEYRRIRGVYFDLMAEPPGAVATDQSGLTELLLSGETTGPNATRLGARFRERFCPHDDGDAAERVVRRIFPVGEPPTGRP